MLLLACASTSYLRDNFFHTKVEFGQIWLEDYHQSLVGGYGGPTGPFEKRVVAVANGMVTYATPGGINPTDTVKESKFVNNSKLISSVDKTLAE